MNRAFVPATLIAVLTVFFSATFKVAYAEPDIADVFHTPRSLMLSVLDVIENEYVDPVDATRLLNAALDGASEATHLALPALPAVLPEPQARLRALGAVTWAASRAGRSLHNVDESAAAAMVASLHDRHTVFMPAQKAQELKLIFAGVPSYVGIGVRTTVLAGADGISWPYVTDVLPHTPAAVAGLRAFDRIVAIDGIATTNLAPARLEAALRGRGTVSLEIARAGRPSMLTVARGPIIIPGAVVTVMPGGIVSARFVVIRRDAVELLGQTLSRLKRWGRLRGALVDLRDTRGGEEAAIPQMLRLFLSAGTTVFHTGEGGRIIAIRTDIAPVFPHLPLAVLVNGRTASAAEVISAALHDAHRAAIVGERTAGAVNGAVFQPLPRGAAMLVTVQRLTGALGEPLEGIGVQPDVQVSLDAADLDRGHDAQVAVAVQRLRVAMAATAR